jgi:hypothetical protein
VLLTPLGSPLLNVSCQNAHTSQSLIQFSAAFGGFLRVLEVNEPISVVAIPEVNQFLVHCDSALYSYPLDMVVSVSQGITAPLDLDSSTERWAGEHEHVSFLKAGRVADQSLGK